MVENGLFQWDHVASAFGAITTILLTYLISRLGKIEEKQELHQKEANHDMTMRITKAECQHNRDECERLKHHAVECDISSTKKRVEQVSDMIDFHSHTGLPADSAVIKRRNNHNHG